MSSSRAFIILLASTCSEFMCFFKWCQISGNGWVCTTGIWIFPWETHTSVWVLGTGSTLVSSSTTRWVWPTPCGITQHPRPARPTFGCPLEVLGRSEPGDADAEDVSKERAVRSGPISWGIPRALRWWIVAGFWFTMVFGARGNGKSPRKTWEK